MFIEMPPPQSCVMSEYMRNVEIQSIVNRCVPNGVSSRWVESFFLLNKVRYYFSSNLSHFSASYRHGFLGHRQALIQIKIEDGKVVDQQVYSIVTFL